MVKNMTEFTKTVPNSTWNEIQFIADYLTDTLAYLGITKHIAIDGQVCFH